MEIYLYPENIIVLLLLCNEIDYVVSIANTKLDIPFMDEKQEKELFDHIYNRMAPAFREVTMRYLGEESNAKG